MRLYCKKTFLLEHYTNQSSAEKIFLKNHSYEAEKYTVEMPCAISIQTPDCVVKYTLIKVKTNDNRTISFNCENLKNKKQSNIIYEQYYKRYFYTEAEMRRMKLDKLNSPLNKLLKIFK